MNRFETFAKEVLEVIRDSDDAQDLTIWSDAVGTLYDRARELFGEDWKDRLDEIFKGK